MSVRSFARRRLAGVPLLLALPLVVALPGVSMFALYEHTGNPFLRFLALTEERIARADQTFSTNTPYVRVRIFWRGPSANHPTPEALQHDLRETFFVKGVDAHVAVIGTTEAGPDPRGTTILFRAGKNTFGPFTTAQAARHIEPATHAAYLAYDPAATTEGGTWWE